MTRDKISCQKRILDAMIDIFDKDIKIIEPDEEHYQFTVTVNENGTIFLSQQYLDAITIIEPLNIFSMIKKTMQKACEQYKTESAHV